MSQSKIRRLYLFNCLVFLFFFQPLSAFRPLGTLDEACYVRWLSFFLRLEHPGCFSDQMQAGIVAIWFPLGLIVRAMGLFIADLDYSFWLPISIAFSSFLAWSLSTFLIAKILEHEGFPSLSLTLLTVLNIPVLYYATRNPALVHAGELFLALLMVRFCQKQWWLAAVGTAALLTATRWNDAPALFLVLGWMSGSAKRIPRARLLWPLCFLIAMVFLVKTYHVGFIRGYNSSSLPQMLRAVEWRNLTRTFFASDWGLIYLNPIWCGAIWFGLAHLDRLPRRSIMAVGWLLAELLLVVLWRGNGRYFGHRYLIGSYAALILLAIDLVPFLGVTTRRLSVRLSYFTAGWLILLLMLFPNFWPWPLHDHYSEMALPVVAIKSGLRPEVWLQALGLSPLGAVASSFAVRFGWLTTTDYFYRFAFMGVGLWILFAVLLMVILGWWGLNNYFRSRFVRSRRNWPKFSPYRNRIANLSRQP